MIQCKDVTKYNVEYFILYNSGNIPLRFHRKIIYLTDTVSMGNVIRNMLITSTISPQTCIIAYINGTLETNINKLKIIPARSSDRKLFVTNMSFLGHRPVISKPKRCISTAHTKSKNVLYKTMDLDGIITNYYMDVEN